MCLRKKIPVEQYLFNNGVKKTAEETPIGDSEKKKLKEILNETSGTEKAFLLDNSLNKIKSVSIKRLNSELKRTEEGLFAIVLNGTATSAFIDAAEETNCKVIVAKNFATTDTKIKLLSL